MSKLADHRRPRMKDCVDCRHQAILDAANHITIPGDPS